MSLKSFDRGAVVLLQIEFKKQEPYSTAAYYDPTTPKITVLDPSGVKKVDAANLTNSATGKWYYLCQTATAWAAGDYNIQVDATVGSYTDVTVRPKAFRLV